LNGGLLPLPELIRRICVLRGIEGEGGVTEEDVKRAVGTMGPLGSGLEIIDLGGGGSVAGGGKKGGDVSRKALRSGGALVNSDSAALVGLAMGTGGRLTVGVCVESLGWREERAKAVLQDEMVEREGIAWVDDQSEEIGGREWWISGVVEWGE
jgi:ESCRT-II complex subunit VPS22